MRTKRASQQNLTFRCLLFTFCMLVFSGGLYAAGEEEYQKKKITVQANQETVEQVLNKIGKAAEVRFFYNHSAFDFSKKISIDAKEQELRNVIGQVLAEYPVDVEYQLNHTIVLRQKTQNIASVEVQKVSGRVTDAKNGEALIGASIVLKESPGIGVVTDIDGNFHLELAQGSATALIVSFIGYQTEEIKLSGSGNVENVTVKLTPMATELEDVVVTGMAPRKASGFTGRYVTVKGDELKRLNPNNLLQALSMFDPSFHIVENNLRGSDPNALPEFRLRGDVQLGTVSESAANYQMMMGDYSNRPNMPLFILDGFETTLQRIVDLDPERVESITILKDAAGTAMYGSKASNGVLIFETKKPQPGALTVNYSGNVGVSIPDLSDYNLMNASEKLDYELRAGLFTTANMLNYYNKYKAELLRGVNTYWLSEPLRTAATHRHSLSLEGGDEAIRYSLNLNYGNEFGVMKGSDRNNMGLGLTLSYRRKKWNISNSLSMTNTLANNSPYGSFSQYTKLNPYYRMKDESGRYQNIIEIKPMGAGSNQQTITNPLYNTQFPYKDLSKNFSIVDNFSLEYAIMDNLRLNGQVSFTKGTARTEQFKSSNHTDFANVEDLTERGSYMKNTGESIGWNANASINYNWVSGKHGLFAVARWNVESSVSDGINLSAKGFPNDNMNDFLFAFEMDQRVSGNESTSRSVGVLGSLNYMYDQKYSVDVNIRGDLSSQFGGNTGMAPFWSVGTRWNAHREKWFEGTIVSNLTVSANMGITGSQSYSPYQAKETYSFADLMFPYPGGDVLGAQLMGIGNPDLGWSKTNAKSVAVELGLWNSRLNISASYYHNYTDQMLLATNVQPSTGFPTYTRNVGAVLNEGIDVTVNGLLISDYERQMQWSLGINLTHNRNVIKKLSNELKEMNRENQDERDKILPVYEEGESTTVLKLVPSLGIDPATGEEMFLKLNGEKTFVWDAADKIPVGDTEPKVRGTIPTSFIWKNLTVNMAFSFQVGGDRFNQTLLDKIENSNISENVDKRAGGADRWSPTNRYAKYKKISIDNQQTPTSTRFLQRYNEFVFNSIGVGYRFDPKQFKFLEICKIASLSLNASMQDIGRISTVKQERGLDYPFARSFNLSVSVLFN